MHRHAHDRDQVELAGDRIHLGDTVEIGARKRTTRARIVEAGTDEEALARRSLLEKYSPRSTDDLTGWSRTALPVAVDWPA